MYRALLNQKCVIIMVQSAVTTGLTGHAHKILLWIGVVWSLASYVAGNCEQLSSHENGNEIYLCKVKIKVKAQLMLITRGCYLSLQALLA